MPLATLRVSWLGINAILLAWHLPLYCCLHREHRIAGIGVAAAKYASTDNTLTTIHTAMNSSRRVLAGLERNLQVRLPKGS